MINNKPQIINGSYNFIVRYKNDNEIELKHFFANVLQCTGSSD